MQSTLNKLLNFPAPDESYLLYQSMGIDSSEAPALIEIISGKHFADEYLLTAEKAAEKNTETINVSENFDFAQIHAWRALAQLNNLEHIPFFIQQLENHEFRSNTYYVSDFIIMMGKFYREESFNFLQEYLFNTNHPESVTCIIVEALENLVDELVDVLPDTYWAVVKTFTNYLDNLPYTRETNAYIINALLSLEATNSYAAIRKIHHNHLAKLTTCGDLEHCEIRLGIRKKRLGPKMTTENLQKSERKEEILARKILYALLKEGDKPQDIIAYFLQVYKTTTTLPSYAKVNGFITGSLLFPNPPSLSTLLPLIWTRTDNDKENAPKWINQTDPKTFKTAIQSVMKDIRTLLSLGKIHSIQTATKGSPTNLQNSEWIQGFVSALDHWEKKTSHSKQLKSLINAAYRVILLEDGPHFSSSETQEAFDHLIQEIFRFFEIKQPRLLSGHASNATPNVTIIDTSTPRNAPCPCGSGKKYKKCCL